MSIRGQEPIITITNGIASITSRIASTGGSTVTSSDIGAVPCFLDVHIDVAVVICQFADNVATRAVVCHCYR
jgi:hypothetical protein